ncbi:hypothetical protein KI387_024818, partial [Taxus chinensis]
GPKLRKWYGAPDQLPRDRNHCKFKDDKSKESEKDDIREVRDAVLVTDGDSDIGQIKKPAMFLYPESWKVK